MNLGWARCLSPGRSNRRELASSSCPPSRPSSPPWTPATLSSPRWIGWPVWQRVSSCLDGRSKCLPSVERHINVSPATGELDALTFASLPPCLRSQATPSKRCPPTRHLLTLYFRLSGTRPSGFEGCRFLVPCARQAEGPVRVPFPDRLHRLDMDRPSSTDPTPRAVHERVSCLNSVPTCRRKVWVQRAEGCGRPRLELIPPFPLGGCTRSRYQLIVFSNEMGITTDFNPSHRLAVHKRKTEMIAGQVCTRPLPRCLAPVRQMNSPHIVLIRPLSSPSIARASYQIPFLHPPG